MSGPSLDVPASIAGRFLIWALVVWSGCDLIGTSEPVPTVSLSLTNEHTETIEEARVQIETIYFEEAGSSGRDTLRSKPSETLDLADRHEDLLVLVENETVRPGVYDQLRLVLGTIEIRTSEGRYSITNFDETDGQGGSLHCVNCPEDGVEVPLPRPGLTLDQETNTHVSVVVDFDVSQSFERRPDRPEAWTMHPVVSAAVVDRSGSIDGHVRLSGSATLPETCGSIRPSIRNFTPVLRSIETDSILKSARVGTDGTFTFEYIPPVVHRAGYEKLVDVGTPDSALAFDATVEPEDPYIQNGETTQVEMEIVNASCEAVRY